MQDQITYRQLSTNETKEIAAMLLNGQDRSSIKAHIMARLESDQFNAEKIIADIADSWNVPLPKVNEALESAFSNFELIEDDSRRHETLLAYARLTELYRLNMEKSDYKECREVQKEINKLLGLNAPERSEIKTDVQTEFKVVVVNQPQKHD